jgi:excinuclease ABC subunit A
MWMVVDAKPVKEFHQCRNGFYGGCSVPCETCNGKRFRREVLKLPLLEKISMIFLTMTIDDAVAFFETKPSIKITQKLKPARCWIRYVQLGQSSSTLSVVKPKNKTSFFSGKRSDKRKSIVCI